jgi:tetratricopeptide (TPR) repeat protein
MNAKAAVEVPVALPGPVASHRLRAAASAVLAGAWLALFVWLAGAFLPARAGEAPSAAVQFDAANRLYEQGRYREAAAAYERLLAQGRATSALYFNLGNAWFKAGEAGRAILNYRLAERLAPRDPDIQANLRLTRELVRGGPVPAPSLWQRGINALTPGEWGFLTVFCAWLCFGALTAAELWPGRLGACRRWAAVAGVLAVTAGTCLAAQWFTDRRRLEAVVTAKEAIVRYGPLQVSRELQKVTDGAELIVLDEKDGWLQVAGLARGPGWIQAADVALLPQ